VIDNVPKNYLFFENICFWIITFFINQSIIVIFWYIIVYSILYKLEPRKLKSNNPYLSYRTKS